MRILRIRVLYTTFLAVGLLAVSVVKADPMPPTVSYSLAGSSSNWTLDFTVYNNTNQTLYFFGVLLPATDITGSPSGAWCAGCDTPWSNAPWGGSSVVYNNVWIGGSIGPETSLGGFTALDTADVAAPTSIDWFAWTSEEVATEGPYTGGGNFNAAIGGCNPPR
jgi:hypothetical protein